MQNVKVLLARLIAERGNSDKALRQVDDRIADLQAQKAGMLAMQKELDDVATELAAVLAVPQIGEQVEAAKVRRSSAPNS